MSSDVDPKPERYSMNTQLTALLALVLVFAACSGEVEPSDTVQATVETTSAAEAPAPEVTKPQAGPGSYKLAEGSEVSFEIPEILRGNRELVVGSTSSVTGEVTFDPTDPNAATGGFVSVDAGSLMTNEDRRNEAIRRFILDTVDFPEITFMVTGLSVADTDTVTLEGDLTVRDITIPVTFTMQVLENGLGRVVLEGSAMVTRESLNLDIPSVPFVADVSDEVTLKATLVFDS
jgi:polyisoprenoid-binding protein YceI